MSSDFQTLPSDPYDALTLDNDIFAVRVWGTPGRITLSLGRSDIWDRRWFGDRQPLITLQQLEELAAADRLDEVAPGQNDTVYDVYGRYDFPCPKPGGQVILLAPFAETARVRRVADGSVEVFAEGGGKRLEAIVRVCLARCIAAIECQGDGLTDGDLAVRVYRHRDTCVPGGELNPAVRGGGAANEDFEQMDPPEPFEQDGCFGVEQTFPPEPTFPDGFRAAVAARVLASAGRAELRRGETGLGTPLRAEKEGRLSHMMIKKYTPINESPGAAATASVAAPGGSLTVLAGIATSTDADDPAVEVGRMLTDAASLGADGLAEENRRLADEHRRQHPARLRLDASLAEDPPSRMQPVGGEGGAFTAPPQRPVKLRRRDGYYGDVPLTSVVSTKQCFQDSSPWHGDFHLNELHPDQMLPLGMYDELLPYCQMIRTMLPMAEENARDVYALDGAMYPLLHFPLRTRGVCHANLTWEQDMGLNGLACKPLWLWYRHTGDRDFLAETAWPVLRSCARFMRAYVRDEADGRLHIVPSVSPEHWGLTARWERNRDCLSALTLARYLWNAAADAADILGAAEREEAAEWRAAAGRLAEFPTYDTPDGPVWVDVSGAPPIEYNIPVPLSAIFWGDEVGLDSPPEVLAIARRTLEHIRVWKPHSFYLARDVRPRLGLWVEGDRLVPERLLQSHQSIRVFPAVPPEGRIEMRDFCAEGGFRVSAVRTESGEIEDVAIHSTLGGGCRAANPWPGRKLSVESDGSASFPTSQDATHCTFQTRAGETYRLRPR